ncbi:MAG TPA: hypothetical protein IAB47_01995 [Candidatus Scatomorpha merdigallinarum]|nr:hypothetical protein [Candidatus Scatomorpha merdigallinarum]
MVLSLIGIVIAMVFVVVSMFKGLKPLLAGVICSFIICIFCGVGYEEGIATEYAESFATSVRQNLMTFLSCSVLSKVMLNTKCAKVIADGISRVINPKHAPISLFLICFVLRLGGMSVGAYMMTFAIGLYICKKADYSEDILLACVVGCCYTVATFAPMFPSPTNALLQNAFGTSSTAGMLSGMVTSVVCAVLILVYQEWTCRRWKKRGRTFKADYMIARTSSSEANADAKEPNFVIAIIPVIVVFVFYNVFAMSASAAMFLGAFACIILNFRVFTAKQWLADVTKGAYEGITPIVALAAMAGIGGAITVSPLYTWLGTAIGGTGGMDPLIASAGIASLFAALLGSANAGISACTEILMPAINASVAAGQYSFEAFHRLIACAAAPWSALPHNGAINSMMAMFDTDFKRSYTPTIISGFVIPLACTICITLPMTLMGLV